MIEEIKLIDILNSWRFMSGVIIGYLVTITILVIALIIKG